MSLYAESSALLRWLLQEPDPEGVVRELRAGRRILTSDLTLLECRRALIRLAVTGMLPRDVADRRRQDLERAAAAWDIWPMDSQVLQEAAREWPREPIRSLDAVHLGTAWLARQAVPDLRLASLDHRVRENAAALGLPLVPP